MSYHLFSLVLNYYEAFKQNNILGVHLKEICLSLRKAARHCKYYTNVCENRFVEGTKIMCPPSSQVRKLSQLLSLVGLWSMMVTSHGHAHLSRDT